MNYEDLYMELQPIEKKTKDAVAGAQKFYKGLVKDVENGDIKSIRKSLQTYEDIIALQKECLDMLKAGIEGFDAEYYFSSGEFTGQMLDICKSKGIDVVGEAPVFEMFPYRIKVDADNQDLYVDRKKVSCMRPSSFVTTIKTGQDKLNRASFNAEAFAAELADSYDMTALKMKKAAGADIMLTGIYKVMVPMSRSRKEYDQQSFAFDIARLYAAQNRGELETIKDGRHFQFGPSRNNGKSIRILDGEGNEQFLATIRFF